MPTPKIINQPQTHEDIQSGITQIVNAIKPTLGPLSRYLVHIQDNKIERLDDGGTIARRILQVGNPHEDVGVMLLRQVLWQVNQQVGDGTATTAVLYETIYNEGLRYIAAGANPMQLRDHLLSALQHINAELTSQRQTITDLESLKSIAYSICYDRELADTLGDIFDTVGQYGQVDIHKGNGRGIEHKFVEGTYIKGGVQSKDMLRGYSRHLAELYDTSILVTDLDIEQPKDLIGLMQLAIRSQMKTLLLVVNSISELGLSVILNEKVANQVKVVVVKIDGFVQDDLIQARQDIAALVGGNIIHKAAGQTLDNVQESDFGSARWVWADENNFGFAGGHGNPYRLREHITILRTAYDNSSDDDHRGRLLKRLGRLYGGSASVHIGGVTSNDIDLRKALAERTVRSLRSAIAGGVIPGGGIALLNCQKVLRAKALEQDTVEGRAAYEILAKAVEAPIRTLLSNAGYNPSEILAKLPYEDNCDGFDVIQQQFVNITDEGIFDVAHVQQEAIQRAVAGASQALTIDVMILHRNPEMRVNP